MYILISLLLSIALSAADRQTPPPSITKYDRGATLAMLKQVKADLKDYYYDGSFRGLDLDAVFSDAEGRLKSSVSLSQSIGTIAEVLMRLEDSHTIFLPPDRKARVRYGWQPTMIGGVPYVTWVSPQSDAAKQGVDVGDRVLAWNEYAPNRDNLWKINYIYGYVRPQPVQRLVLRKPDGAVKSLDVQTSLEQRDEYELPDLIVSMANLFGHVGDRDTLVGDIFVWRYTGFGDAKDVDRVMKKVRGAKSLILDMRGNSGGTADALRNMVSWLFNREVRVFMERTRKGDKAVDAKGRKDAFDGRLVVLVDSGSASSAEVLARLVQLEKRGTVIGDRTAGGVMTARLIPHVYGDDKLTFYATSITVGDIRMADGSSLEKIGVTPDETALPTGADLTAKRDPVLARALAALGATMTAEEAGRLFR